MNNVTELKALNTDSISDGINVYFSGYRTEFDGGGGIAVYSADSVASADNGSVFAPDSGNGRFLRVFNEGYVTPEMWGARGDGSTDDSAAINLMYQWVADQGPGGGSVRFTPGRSYVIGQQVVVRGVGITTDWTGCTIIPDYASGAQFVIGDGGTRSELIKFIGGFIQGPDNGPDQAIFETRHLRSFFTEDIHAVGIYKFIVLGRASDGSSKGHYQWWSNNLDVNMRVVASGDHSHAIEVANCSGNISLMGTYFEADHLSANSPHGIHIHSNAQTRVDELHITGGNLKKFARAISSHNARLVNVQIDPSARFDDYTQHGMYFYANSALDSTGIGNVSIAGVFGGFPAADAIGIYIELALASSGGMDNIRLHDITFNKLRNSAIKVVATGTGAIYDVSIDGIDMKASGEMPDATTDVIVLNGGGTTNLRNLLVGNLNFTSYASTNKPRHIVLTNTTSTSVAVDTASIVATNYTGSLLNTSGIGGSKAKQSFRLFLTNNAGTLQHKITAQLSTNAAPTAQIDRVNGASATYQNTPAGTDASTAFVTGVKLRSADLTNLFLDTAWQSTEEAIIANISVAYNSSGTPVNIRPGVVSSDINGATRTRPLLEFRHASTGDAFALNTTSIPSGKSIELLVELWIS